MIAKLFTVAAIVIFCLFIPAAANAAEKKIEVNLTTQTLTAKEDNQIIYNFPVSTGKWSPTPTGGFWPWIKLRFSNMTGGSRQLGTYYNLVNVPYVVYFYNENYPKSMGYSLHGTYWHSNFGYPMSHGCVNVKTSDMAQLYNWLDLQTKIEIFGQTPAS